jgi:hypothetical protein
MTRKDRRGRPYTFLPADRQYLAQLVREHGIAGAQRQTGIPISDQTLSKIAHEFGIVLPKGRRPRAA